MRRQPFHTQQHNGEICEYGCLPPSAPPLSLALCTRVSPESGQDVWFLLSPQAVTRPSLVHSLNGTQCVDLSSHNLMFFKVPEQTSTKQLRVNDVWGDGHREGENEVHQCPVQTSPAANLKTGRCLGLSLASSSMSWARTVSSGWSSSPLSSRREFCKEGDFYEVLFQVLVMGNLSALFSGPCF